MRQITLQQANKAVTLKDGVLFMGTHKVENVTQYQDGKIAALYMVRVYDKEGYPVIVTGLDLMKDGKIWLGGYPIGLWKDGNQGRQFKLLKIQMDLQGIDPERGLFSMSLVLAAREGKMNEVIEMIRTQAKANRQYMIEIIGENLLHSIETL